MTDDGKPCYLTSASAGGVISKMADAMEAEQIRTAREVLAESRLMLEEERLGRLELRFVSKRLTECLADALRVAESRGIRIGIEDPRPDDDMEELTDSGAGE
ncbi:hypothetical protein P1P75_00870 [Streptomyces sp. ID05-39B]|uniref:hypothetical protein n=1 Tax=Streptomyces sp. ID05-39B TaxID=3028664 RepID=UPI0029A3412E|nr:hypothetical protein [Streptomyces sp. ID05-39B]MDX3525040.1 hypothetical protein [Streptomyces sp. ID05-39B]